jgi:multicomponent Na+:H+ antiporter subunit F
LIVIPNMLIEYILIIGLLISSLPLLYALWRGPTTSDRALVFEVFGTMGTLLLAILSFLSDRSIYLDIALLMALFNFVGVVAIARYLERGLLQ